MISLTRFQCNVSANWRFGILALFFCVLFGRLGMWQLARADEKKQMLAMQHQRATEIAIDWHSGETLPLQYQPIHVHGHFSPITLLLDNQHYQHQFGYNVLSPLILDKGDVVLVDRGWVPGHANRDDIPEITTPSTVIEVEGNVYYPAQKSWSLGNIFDKKKDNVAVIELIDAQILSQFLHKSVYPFIIRMHPKAPNGFVREWPVVAMPPDRHVAYAVQWFAMALVVVLLYFILSIKKRK